MILFYLLKEKGDGKMLRRHSRSISIFLCLALLCAFLPNLRTAAAGDFPTGEGELYITGQKIWEDNNDAAGLRPTSVTIRLYADGAAIDSKTITEANGWRYSFDVSDRPILNSQGNQVIYTVG